MTNIVGVGDSIRLKDKRLFCSLHNQNAEIASVLKDNTVLVSEVDDSGDVREVIINGNMRRIGIYKRELISCFEINPALTISEDNIDESGHGSFKIIVTYQDGNTIEEEGVTEIIVKPNSVGYTYNRKKYGFIKYSGEVALELTDLKQITVSTPHSERVLHIENGIIIREHIMYDSERVFKGYRIGS